MGAKIIMYTYDYFNDDEDEDDNIPSIKTKKDEYAEAKEFLEAQT